MSKTLKQDPKFRAARKATTGKRKPAADYFGRYWSDTERMIKRGYKKLQDAGTVWTVPDITR